MSLLNIIISGLNQPVDVYCERTSSTFWAEPVNALSNLAFLIAGYLILRFYLNQCKERGEKTHKDFWILLLIGLIFIVGIGSFLFHTFATLWALIMDVIPIMVFGFIYLGVALKRVIKLNYIKSGICLGLFILIFFNLDLILPEESLNRSGTYLPYLIALIIFAVILSFRKDSNSKTFWIASGLLACAFISRMVDMVLCPYFPLGTHFLWHILNGIMMYVVVKALVDVQMQESELLNKEDE